MKATILIGVDIDHDGLLTGDELAATLGAWVQALPIEYRRIETEDEFGNQVLIRITRASGAADLAGVK